ERLARKSGSPRQPEFPQQTLPQAGSGAPHAGSPERSRIALTACVAGNNTNFDTDGSTKTMTFKNRTVLVTGGNSGIGKAIALRAAAEGARLAICWLDASKAAVTF